MYQQESLKASKGYVRDAKARGDKKAVRDLKNYQAQERDNINHVLGMPGHMGAATGLVLGSTERAGEAKRRRK